MWVGFEVSKANARPSLSVFLPSPPPLISDQDVALSCCSSTMHAAMFPAMMIMD